MIDFAGTQIKAVILNGVNRKTYLMLKEPIEKHTSVPVLGFMPRVNQAELKSRHLGLVQSMEITNLDKLIGILAEQAEKNINFEALINLFSETDSNPFPSFRRRNLVVAIAKDKAFSFYYRENLKLFEESCIVKYFSPLNNSEIPECDLLYLGGGYPEVFRNELNANKTMRESVKKYALAGGCTYAECGGMIYLFDAIEGTEMVGVLKGESRVTSKLQRFGYVAVTLLEDCMLGKVGDTLNAHEFHRSETSTLLQNVFRVTKAMSSKSWQCGYRFGNVLAGYPHLNFLGNLGAFECILDYVTNLIHK
jgi:cobyrinic acid a,c-diamide synthase